MPMDGIAVGRIVTGDTGARLRALAPRRFCCAVRAHAGAVRSTVRPLCPVATQYGSMWLRVSQRGAALLRVPFCGEAPETPPSFLPCPPDTCP